MQCILIRRRIAIGHRQEGHPMGIWVDLGDALGRARLEVFRLFGERVSNARVVAVRLDFYSMLSYLSDCKFS
jgi:hypothetical protein